MATADVVTVDLRAKTAQYDAAIRRSSDLFTAEMNSIGRAANVAERAISGNFMRMASVIRGAGLVGAIGGAAAAVVGAGDQYNQLGNRLRAVGVESRNLVAEQQKVINIALASNTPLSTTGDLYAKLYSLTNDLGVSTDKAAIATQTISQALSLSGISAGAASGALIQLGQALQSGTLRGDEFNSIMEAMGTSSPLIQAIANEFGVAATELRGLAENGELVSNRVFKAILEAAPEIERRFGNIVPTLESAATNANTAFVGFAGAMDKALGASSGLAQGLQSLVPWINSATKAIDGMAEARAKNTAAEAANFRFAQRMRQGPLGPDMSNLVQERQARQTYAQAVAIQRQLGVATGPGRAPSGPGPAAPGGIDEAMRGRGYGAFGVPYLGALPAPRPPQELGAAQLGDVTKPAGGGGGRAATTNRLDEYERATEALTKRTDNLTLERNALALSEEEAAKRKATIDLERAAEEAGLPITAERRAQIDALSQAYADQVRQLEAAREAQERIDEFAQQSLGAIKQGFLDVAKGAKTFSEALQDILGKLTDIVLSQAFDQIFGTGKGGILGGVLGSLFGGAGGGVLPGGASLGTGGIGAKAAGGQVSPGRGYIVGERGPELLVPGNVGSIVPTGALGKGGGGNVQVVVNAPPGTKVTGQRTEQQGDLKRVVVDLVNEHIATGGADGALKGRFGTAPRKVR